MNTLLHTFTTPTEATEFFRKKYHGKEVITFMGFSGAGYEDQSMVDGIVNGVLQAHSPEEVIINAGATPDGIGRVYTLARAGKYTTTGIVSSLAKEYPVAEDVDEVYFIEDEHWGGLQEGRLSPTSRVMVDCSDVFYVIGGNVISKDEVVKALELKKRVKFFPAEMNHEKAIQKAMKKGNPIPTDFTGEMEKFWNSLT